jgi:hypothetical protein
VQGGYTEEGGGTSGGRTGGVNVHGVRSLQNNFVQDGVDNNSISTNVQELTTQVARPLDPWAVNLIAVRLRAVNPESVQPYVDQWNLGVQRLLPGDIVITVDYVGTKGTHLTTLRNLNQQTFGINGVGTGVIPYSGLGPIEFRWFDPTAYAVPTPARLGSCGRNTLYGPGLANFDFAVTRSFECFGEGKRLELRWEMFNMFNTPQFGLPERNISSRPGA